MKQVGLPFFGKERGPIYQPVVGIPINNSMSRPSLSEEEFREIVETPLERLLHWGQEALSTAIQSDRGVEISRKLLATEETWELNRRNIRVTYVFEKMIVNGAANLLIEAAYKRKDQMDEFSFRQIARFAAYNSGEIDEFVNHPLMFLDEIWSGVIAEEIDKHLNKCEEGLKKSKKSLVLQLTETGVMNEQALKDYVDTLSQSETAFLLHCVKGKNLNVNALTRFIRGKVSVLEFPKDGSRLQLFRDFDGQTYLVNTVDKSPAASWKVIAEKLSDITVPYLKETQRKEETRVYSENVGLSTDSWDVTDLPFFLRMKLEKLVDHVEGAIRGLGYGDHRGYRNNYCYYFVDKHSGVPTIDFSEVYKRLGDFGVVVKRIDLDAMHAFAK